MAEYILASQNGRTIPTEDAIFGVNTRASQCIREYGKENVIDATIGKLLDDQGNLLVLASVDEVYRSLKPEEYANYAPIAGTPGFRKAAIQAALKNNTLKRIPRACAAPGGTGALRLAVGNYSSIGDTILTTDWHWGPYGKIAGEIGRSVETFRLFDNDRNFDVEEFRSHVNGLAEKQDTLLIILNSPGQNPTGYRLTDEEWKSVIAVLSALPSSKKIALVADTAYIDFAGDEDDVRTFLPLFDTLPDNVMALLAYSFSKTFTLYGMRCGALIGLAPDERTAEEFSRVTEYSGRASWSNCARAGQAIIEHIYEDPALLERVTAERTEIRNMLLARGAAFGEEASKCGLDMLPYNGGFFAVVPCENAKEVGLKLEKEAHAFTIPFGDGLRVSLAAMPMTQCRILPQKMKDVLSSME
ncbi:pyridoxal phosphate-dependent aminotransferase [Eubacterium pyruvativorans]|uniref:pyridoxal phosphate-dependent aminotransferase n=1 Tax=Eubacterium pyruvativorans TaxID=155865 RepID=UPI0023F028D6|nr:aminotransferase class I/II-fold pyridoxal phosphate-dependent enzyme [Eubacterium pyruvativorans]MCI5747666.1 aminotransferase class I/II-fold pyridoxal phosphate-dependent enzyme [Eubacterium pyruvativorans]MDD6707469.1 aminotransferase class I/II-fold pyridoxal phosphate-dependent enzyme [Eubacterium pyruvativorans]MDD7684326.1 aminotransferase class I/II-fold pyridoxal phosphate-dependent enzyme [Eubacterium pyruvativorans]